MFPLKYKILDDFLDCINYKKINKLPYNNDPIVVATHARNHVKAIRKLKGETLLNWNIELEAERLQINDRNIINWATKHIWNSKLTDCQRNEFSSLANKA